MELDDHDDSGRDAAVALQQHQQARLSVLATAFKSGAVHKPSITMNPRRNPSQLTLTKRQDHLAAEPTIGGDDYCKLQASTCQNEPTNSDVSGLENMSDRAFVSVSSTDLRDIEDENVQSIMSTQLFRPHTNQSISKVDLLVTAELQWLTNYPQSKSWRSIHRRVIDSRSEESSKELKEQNSNVAKFFDSAILQGAEHVNNLLSGADNEKERLVVRLAFSLLEEAVIDVITEVCNDVMQHVVNASAVLHKSMFKALSNISLGLEGSGSRFWKMSGREHILKGVLSDNQRTKSFNILGDCAGRYFKKIVDLNDLPITSSESYRDEVSLGNFDPVCDSNLQLQCWICNTCDTLHDAPNADTSDSEAESVYDSVELNENNLVRDEVDIKLTRALSSFEISPLLLPPPGIESFQRHDPVQMLYQFELQHWTGVKIAACTNSPIQVPSSIATAPSSGWGQSVKAGVVTATAIIGQPVVSYASTLLCGLNNGRLAAYSIPWSGGPIELLAVSPPLEKKDQDCIVQIEVAPLNAAQIACKTAKGVVLVYNLNPCLNASSESGIERPARATKSWFPLTSLFTQKNAQRNNPVQSITLSFRIEPNDNLFSLSSLEETIKTGMHRAEATEAERTLASVAALRSRTVQESPAETYPISLQEISDEKYFLGSASSDIREDLVPSAICFHSSVSMLGSASSVMVATQAGDIVKHNLDYFIGNADAPLKFPTHPFVEKEFIHPSNAPSGFVLTAGVADKCGNKVFRELFHFHRSKVVSVDPIMRTSNFLVSLDQSGRIATWQYGKECFTGKCWFQPYSTTMVSLKVKEFFPSTRRNDVDDFENSSDINWVDGALSPCEPVSETIRAKLRVKEAFEDKEHRRVIKWYQPVYSRSKQSWIQFCSVEPILFSEVDIIINKKRPLTNFVSDRHENNPSNVATTADQRLELANLLLATTVESDVQVNSVELSPIPPADIEKDFVEFPTGVLNDPVESNRSVSHFNSVEDSSHASNDGVKLDTRSILHEDPGNGSTPINNLSFASGEPAPIPLTSFKLSSVALGDNSQNSVTALSDALTTVSARGEFESIKRVNSGEMRRVISDFVSDLLTVACVKVLTFSTSGERKRASLPLTVFHNLDKYDLIHDLESEKNSLEEQGFQTSHLNLPGSNYADNVNFGSDNTEGLHSVLWGMHTFTTRQSVQMTILSAKMSLDGSELVILLGSRCPVERCTEFGTSRNYGQVFYVVPYFAGFGKVGDVYPRIYFDNDDDTVVDFAVGPIALETHSRMVFVLTKHAVRLFSLYSGREVRNTSSFPLVWDLPGFTPSKLCVCPNNRILTLSSPEDARQAVFVMNHEKDGEGDVADEHHDREFVLRAISERLFRNYIVKRELQLASVDPYPPVFAVQTVFEMVSSVSEEKLSIVADIKEIVSATLDYVMHCIDESYKTNKRIKLISDIYQGNLGFIDPVSWPPPFSPHKTWLDFLPSSSEQTDNARLENIGNVSLPTRKRKHKRHKKLSKKGERDRWLFIV